MTAKIAPSILSADFTRLGEQVNEAIHGGADVIHVDVMDGQFVPNLTVGPLVVEAIRPICMAAGIPIETHLMIQTPERLVQQFAEAGASLILVHVETCPHLNRTIQQIRDAGARAGVTLNPATSLESLEEILIFVDQVLVMTVNPGFGGQRYLPGSTEKIRRLRGILDERQLSGVEIEVDGGVHTGNVAEIVSAGATILVAGSAVFNAHASVAENIHALRQAARGSAPLG